MTSEISFIIKEIKDLHEKTITALNIEISDNESVIEVPINEYIRLIKEKTIKHNNLIFISIYLLVNYFKDKSLDFYHEEVIGPYSENESITPLMPTFEEFKEWANGSFGYDVSYDSILTVDIICKLDNYNIKSEYCNESFGSVIEKYLFLFFEKKIEMKENEKNKDLSVKQEGMEKIISDISELLKSKEFMGLGTATAMLGFLKDRHANFCDYGPDFEFHVKSLLGQKNKEHKCKIQEYILELCRLANMDNKAAKQFIERGIYSIADIDKQSVSDLEVILKVIYPKGKAGEMSRVLKFQSAEFLKSLTGQSNAN